MAFAVSGVINSKPGDLAIGETFAKERADLASRFDSADSGSNTTSGERPEPRGEHFLSPARATAKRARSLVVGEASSILRMSGLAL